MTTPATIINVRPGYASYSWNYAGATPAGASPVAAVAFDASSSLGQAASRGNLQFSLDTGKTWSNYVLPVDGQGAYVAASGTLGATLSATLWRFQDRQPGDAVTPDSFNVHYRLADGSIATVENTVVVDNQPVGLTGSYDILFTTMQAGDVADVLLPVDTGALSGGRWVIDSQSQPGLFAVAYDRAVDTSGRLVIANAALVPASGGAASATMHYYDRYQVDAGGNPLPNTGVTRTLTYTVEDGSTRDLAGFANEARLGAAGDASSASPSVATLSTGGFVTVWQGPDAALWAQTRDAAGNALGANFALTPNGGAVEGQPAVSALADGRFVVAYTLNDGGANKIAYRVVAAGGSAGAEHVVDGGAAGDAAMPTLATLADGSFAVAWRSGGSVHVQQAAADGSAIGTVHDAGALGSAYSPDLVALKAGGYVLAWGEINDGNVYASINGGTPFVASGDGYAASIATAAPLPHVTALAGGGFVVAWDSYMNDPHGFSISDIYFQRFDGAGHALGGLTQANVASGGGRYDAAVAALADGGFVVTWQGSDDAGNGIFGRRFGADGSALDPHEFAVNQHRAGDQAGADVSALAGGGFVTAWVDTAGDGSVGVEMRVLQGQVADGGAAHLSAVQSAALAAPTPPAIVGDAGNNALSVSAGILALDGGAGLDTAVYSGARASYTVAHDGSGFSVTDAAGGHATLQNIERVQFGDGMVALDVDGTAGHAYRLYQAAFDRTPDKVGLGFWIDVLDHGAPVQDAARDFVGSQEFKDLYGANLSDAQFVDALYQNVLHRPAEGAGFDFWVSSLQIVSRAEVLVNFSESAENQAQVVGSIQNGIDYVHWAG
jgi:hypothetical protein